MKSIRDIIGRKSAPPIPRGSSRSGLFGWFGRLPGADLNYATEAGPVHLNASVQAGLRWIGNAYTVARPVVEELVDGKWEVRPDDKLAALLDNPNPETTGRELRQGIAHWLATDGNAYLLIEKDGAGRPAELWLLPSHLVRIDPSPVGITSYVYGGQTRYQPDQIVHLKSGTNPDDPRFGFSSLNAVLREISADNRISTMYAALTRNMGQVPWLLSPDGEAVMDAEEQTAFAESLKTGFTGENSGRFAITSTPMRAQKLALSPDEMAVDVMRQQVQDRILAAMGLDAAMVGLNRQAATQNNVEAAEKRAWTSRIMPELDMLGDKLGQRLLPLFGRPAGRYRVAWDLADVQALQEDEDGRSKRADTAFRAGGVSLNEYRAMIGQPPVTESGSTLSPDTPRGEPAFASIVAAGTASLDAPPKDTTP